MSPFRFTGRGIASHVLAIALLVFGVTASDAASKSEAEAAYYRITTFELPENSFLEAGGLQLLPDGRLAVSTRFGDIFLVSDPFAARPEAAQFKLFASGLHEVLGLAVHNGWLYATQRGEVTRMKDTNGDDRADIFETVSDQWGINGDYHEYAFGSKVDRDHNLWVVLCLTGSFTSDNPYRGWCLRVNADDGTTVPTASGLRSPGGIGTNYLGDMFYTDNQGPWNGTSGLKHLLPGSFQGNPSGNRWYALTDALGERPRDPQSNSRFHVEAKQIPEYLPAAVLFPYNKMGQSASGIATDATGGKFGPFANQLFVGDQTHSTVMRVYLEKVNGRYQGACFPFLEGFDSGSLSLEFAPTGPLFVGGTDRGWGSRGGKPYALERVDWTGRVPFEMHELRAKPDGFELTFTQAVDPATAGDVNSYRLEAYTYIYRADYGSPEVDPTQPKVLAATVGADRKSVRLVLDRVIEGSIHELQLPGVRNGDLQPLLHPVAYYTMNQLPAGP
jgi:glucose/arabinose dehydrogenase